MSGCTLCPRHCGADRDMGQRGFCGADDRVLIARAAPHYWEEPCISGERGSGAVFFSGCPLGCIYCQNREISRGGAGREVSVSELADIFRRLEKSGVHNLNLVTPTQYTPQIVEALDLAKPQIPVVYNCGGYESVETLELTRGRVQIFLPDFKYASAELAQRYSRAGDYPQVALAAIEKMVELVGEPRFGSDGMMRSGVIVRHLVLPGKADESMKALRLIRERFGDRVAVSVMNQYTPMAGVELDELSRAVTDDEYELVLDYAAYLGIENGYSQYGGTVSESFIPEFYTDGDRPE